MNVLVINLTRFGDLLQTQPVFHGLKALGHRTGLVCLENFASAAELLEDVDAVFALPGAAVLGTLKKDWRDALGLYEHICEEIVRSFAPQRIINTTATLSARLLARRLSPLPEPILGFGMDADGFGISGDIWATFLQGASSQRCNCPFHMADMFRGAAGVSALPTRNQLRKPQAQAVSAARTILATAPPAAQGFVALQLGASEERRQWPISHFAQLGKALWTEFGLCPLLCGSPAERDLAIQYANASQAPFVDAVGATGIPALAALLRESRLLVSNDTGTLHLAAGLQVPSLGIFLATAQPWDTGPYMEDCCCLEPALDCHPCTFGHACTQQHACRSHIDADTALECIRGYLHQGAWPHASANARQKARVWRSTVDAAGFADIVSLSGHDTRPYSQWLRLQRVFYRHIIDKCNGVDCTLPSPLPAIDGLGTEMRTQAASMLRHAEALLLLLCEQGTLAQVMGKSRAGTRLLASHERLHTLLSNYAPLAALGHLWLVLAQERGARLDDVVHTASILRECLGAWRAALES